MKSVTAASDTLKGKILSRIRGFAEIFQVSHACDYAKLIAPILKYCAHLQSVDFSTKPCAYLASERL